MTFRIHLYHPQMNISSHSGDKFWSMKKSVHFFTCPNADQALLRVVTCDLDLKFVLQYINLSDVSVWCNPSLIISSLSEQCKYSKQLHASTRCNMISFSHFTGLSTHQKVQYWRIAIKFGCDRMPGKSQNKPWKKYSSTPVFQTNRHDFSWKKIVTENF